ncbi:MAG: hypothetical protein PVJ68_07190, partial [Candidatus Thiodiazotropha sp.]
MATTSDEHFTLGESGRSLRVLNFAGRGFDTIMQLGTAHALLVIQGRAPDAIVGISSGAIQAVAVAEILQAGEDIPVDRTKSIDHQRMYYQRRQAARVERFRNIIKEAERAPEKLIDASTPDAYQIDSRNPLQPLRTPRFQTLERNKREQFLQVRSGLVTLYNDLLNIHLPIGVITRLIRRWLGFNAAGNIQNRPHKWIVQTLELFRMWLLIGAELPRVVTVAPLLYRPLFINKSNAHVTTAGSLIFRFKLLSGLGRAISYCITLFILATTWVSLSTIFGLIAILTISPDTSGFVHFLIIGALPYFFPLVMTLLQIARRHDALTWIGALSDGLRGLMQFAVTLVIWGLPPFLFIAWLTCSDLHALWPLSLNCKAYFWSATVFASGTAIFVLILIWSWVLSKYERFREHVSGQRKMSYKQWYGKRFLKSYSPSRSILHHYSLEKFLSDLFDPDYFGSSDHEREWENSLQEQSP